MGIKYFFSWFKKNFNTNIKQIPKTGKFTTHNVQIDNLLIDMNGIIHTSAQRIYRYGNFKPETQPKRLLGNRQISAQPPPPPPMNEADKRIRLFHDVCVSIDALLASVEPNKRLILAIDGVAPFSKCIQQRQRRFRSAIENTTDIGFDTSSITPGTEFMENLSKYIDWYIRKNINGNEAWKHLEVIFSSSRSPGEGEHTLVNYIKNYGDLSESFCITGVDADLIMLALSTHAPNMWILREDQYNIEFQYIIDIKAARAQLLELLRWTSEQYIFNERNAIDDFVFLFFMFGNDFLPNIPSIEIMNTGTETVIDIYKNVGIGYGHITTSSKNMIKFNKQSLKILLGEIGIRDKELLEAKLRRKNEFFPDLLLENCATVDPTDRGRYILDIDKYRNEYILAHFPDEDISKVCHAYFQGLQWVINYYSFKPPSWSWNYPFSYCPSAKILAEHIDTFTFPSFSENEPNLPFVQLLSVIPPKSANLLPAPLNLLLTDSESILKPYLPDLKDIVIDTSGVKNLWEAKTILPIIDIELVKKAYANTIDRVHKDELKRNLAIFPLRYRYNAAQRDRVFRSPFGDITNYKLSTQIIDL
uniref:Xrn1 N-terminal domain-containing protein n=1 Tax=viral metagenome TaxID=1070528 RepID=A0A6C0D0N5_9ZZZZ